MVLSANCGGYEFDRSLLHCSFLRRVPQQQPPYPSGRKFLPICWRGSRAFASGHGDFVPVLDDFAVDVPAKAIPEDLIMHPAILSADLRRVSRYFLGL